MKKILCVVCWCICTPLIWVQGQNTIGFPQVINYPKQAYGGGLQNWDVAQDKLGILYIANNEGLLSFDGHTWTLHPLPNRTIVRSVGIAGDGRIYVGGQDELGYFEAGSNGRLHYRSLVSRLPAAMQSFGDVWDIAVQGNTVFFRTNRFIFKWQTDKIAVYAAPSEWAFLTLVNNQLLAHDFARGLVTFQGNQWVPFTATPALPPNDPVTGILEGGNDTLLITTLKNGLFYLTGGRLTPMQTPNNQLFKQHRVYAAVTINTRWKALATNNNGIYIIDLKGNIVQSFSRNEQLQNNNVLSLFTDRQGNLWLGLNNGIDFIAYNSAIKHIMPLMNDGSGYTAMVHNNYLYAGTSNGLFGVPLQAEQDLSFSKGNFLPVAGTQGQAWRLATINNHLLLGHHDGAFAIQGTSATLISGTTGYWNFIPLEAGNPQTPVVAGHYKGLALFTAGNGQVTYQKEVPGFNESSRYLAADSTGNVWVSHPYHGIFRVQNVLAPAPVVNAYSGTHGLPSNLNNHIFAVNNQVVAATQQGVYAFNQQTNRFTPAATYQKLLGNQGLRYLANDGQGNTWYIRDKMLAVADNTGSSPSIVNIPELKEKMLSGFEFIYPYNQYNVFVGGEKGFYLINYAKYKALQPTPLVLIRQVKIGNGQDSLLFGGYFGNAGTQPHQPATAVPAIAPQFKTLHIAYASPLFGYQQNLYYSHYLKGFDDHWSEWHQRTDKEYTNLAAGKYTFYVKVRNNLGKESAVASYSFTILPPWYLTWWARLFYTIMFVLGVVVLVRWQKRKFRRQQQQHEAEQQRLKYIHTLERSQAETELVNLRNQKLETEINFKNSELASSAMHLVKKGELLTRLKNELMQIMRRLGNEQATGELKKLIKSLGEDENLDNEWENFTRHFDAVHGDFILTLKEAHPNLTPNETKLCAYLRMNLSTKEIAQLLNISVRGVEISRYRLRKKLGINTETSLFEYLVGLQTRV